MMVVDDQIHKALLFYQCAERRRKDLSASQCALEERAEATMGLCLNRYFVWNMHLDSRTGLALALALALALSDYHRCTHEM